MAPPRIAPARPTIWGRAPERKPMTQAMPTRTTTTRSNQFTFRVWTSRLRGAEPARPLDGCRSRQQVLAQVTVIVTGGMSLSVASIV